MLAEGRETRIIDGRGQVFKTPIHADAALIKALKADGVGNLVYRKTARKFCPVMAAAKHTVVYVSEIVPTLGVDPENVVPPGMSTHLKPEQNNTLHKENGVLGMGHAAEGDQIDGALINAVKIPVTELPGASFFHHADFFAIMRGGHLDMCVLGAF